MSCNQEIQDSNATATTATADADSGLGSSSANENINTMEPSADHDTTTATTTGNNKETKQESTNSLSLLEEGKLMIAYPTVRGSIRDKKKTSEKLPGIAGSNTTNVSHQYHNDTPSEVESKILRDAKLTVQYPAAHRKLTTPNKRGSMDITPTTPKCMPEPKRISEDSGAFKKDHNRIIVSAHNVHNSRILRHTKELVPFPTCRKGSSPPPEQKTIPSPADIPESYPDTSSGAHVQEVSFPRPSEPKVIPNLQNSEILQTAKNMVDYPACRNDVITASANAYPSGDCEADIPLHINQEEEGEQEEFGIVESEASEGGSTRSSGGGGGGNGQQGNSVVAVAESNPITGLAVARKVIGESSRHLDLPRARPYDGGQCPSQNLEDVQERPKSKKKSIALAAALGVAISLTAILILVFLHGRGTQDIESETNQSNEQSESTPSQILTRLLPNYTLESLKDINSPQSKAFDWTINDPNFDTYEPWRLQQRFSLATFYYSTDGDSWESGSQKSNYKPWLDYEQQECEWFSSSCDSMTLFLKMERFGLPPSFLDRFANECVFNNPCDGQDLEDSRTYKFIAGFKGVGGTIPPEIEMLKSLVGFGFALAGIRGSIPTEVGMLTNLRFMVGLESPLLTGDLPTEVGLLSNLLAIFFYNSAIGGSIPSELGRLSRLESLSMYGSSVAGGIPSELGQATNLKEIYLYANELTGRLPSQLGLLSRLDLFYLQTNALTGAVPTELGQLSHVKEIRLYFNELTGVLPRQLGLLTDALVIHLSHNQLSGHVPSELGILSQLLLLDLSNNSLRGTIKSELGQLSQMLSLQLRSNRFSGNVPAEFAELLNLKLLTLDNNALTGIVPDELISLRESGSLSLLTMANNSFSGKIPEGLCSLGLFDEAAMNYYYGLGLSFDCSGQLCGCCWCPCSQAANDTSSSCLSNPIYPNDAEWPGQFPTQSNAIVINIRTDRYPHENSFEWSRRDESGVWEVLGSGSPTDREHLHSYRMEVESDSLYKLQIFDSLGDGIVNGWFTITNSTPSQHHVYGTVIWEATGYAFRDSLDAFIWVDRDCRAHSVEYFPEVGFVLEDQVVILPDAAIHVSEEMYKEILSQQHKSWRQDRKKHGEEGNKETRI